MAKPKEIFEMLSDMEYLVVGGAAAIMYGVPRHTFDIDLMIFYTEAEIFLNKIKKLGYKKVILYEDKDTEVPIESVDKDAIIDSNVIEFENGNNIHLIIIKKEYKKDWENMIENSVTAKYENITINLVHIIHLYTMKMRSERLKDQEDAVILKEIIERDWKDDDLW